MSSDLSIHATAVPILGDGLRAYAALQPAAPVTRPELLPLADERELVAQAVGELADYVQQSGAELNFRIDDDSGRVIVSLVDTADGTVLLQLPSEEALRIARLLARCQPCLIEAEA